MRHPVVESSNKYENDLISLTVEQQPYCIVKFDIVTKAPAVEIARSKALKNISKEVNLPGFRKGKAPKETLIKQFKPQLENETREVLLRAVLIEAFELTKLRPYSDKSPVDLKKCTLQDDQNYHIVIEFESLPVMPSFNLDELAMQKIEPKPVEDAQLQERLNEFLIYHATYEEVSDRPVAEDDFVTIDMDVIDEPSFSAYHNRQFHIAERKFPNWAKKLLIGLKTGESAVGFTEKETEHDGEFVPRECRITIKKIEKANLPTLDDELAKKAGVNTVEELHSAIKSSLENEARQSVLGEMRKKMRNLLVERYPFDLPASRLKAIQEECDELSYQKDSMKEEERARLKDSLMNDTLQAVKFSFLLPHLVKEHPVAKPSMEQLRERVLRYLISRQASQSEVTNEDAEHLAKLAETEIVAEELLDSLIAKATENTP